MRPYRMQAHQLREEWPCPEHTREGSLPRLCVTIPYWIMSVLSDVLELPADLLGVVGLVRARIESEGDYIAGHETRTRQYLTAMFGGVFGLQTWDPSRRSCCRRLPLMRAKSKMSPTVWLRYNLGLIGTTRDSR